MRRTVIMSHGRDHDARGVKGTFRKGTSPEPTVLSAIPDALGAVGNVPEKALPGDQAATLPRDAKDITTNRRALAHDEGVPVMPGGNRVAGPSTQRPSLEDIAVAEQGAPAPQVPAKPVRTTEPVTTITEPVEEAAPEPVEAPEPEPVTTEPEATEDELVEAEDVPCDPPLPTSKRRLVRAKVDELRAWCAYLDLVPEEYVDADHLVTGDLMRVLVGDKLGINHGIELPDEE